jgi:Cu(I)-responsive transcriptional regulator
VNIKQVEQTIGLTARQIREYEKIGLIPAITRTPSGYRDYSQDSIERLQFIKRARDVDFSLAEIKVLLAMQDNPCRNNSEVKALTAQHIVTLNEKIEQLQAMKSTLQVWHDSCKGDGTAECGILDKLAIKE